MTQDSKKMIETYLTDYFSIKRRKIKSKNWTRVVTIPGGYIRNSTKIYEWTKILDVHLIVVDLTKIIQNMFGCSQKESQDLAMNHLKILEDLRPNSVNPISSRTPRTRKAIRTIPRRRPLI